MRFIRTRCRWASLWRTWPSVKDYWREPAMATVNARRVMFSSLSRLTGYAQLCTLLHPRLYHHRCCCCCCSGHDLLRHEHCTHQHCGTAAQIFERVNSNDHVFVHTHLSGTSKQSHAAHRPVRPLGAHSNPTNCIGYPHPHPPIITLTHSPNHLPAHAGPSGNARLGRGL